MVFNYPDSTRRPYTMEKPPIVRVVVQLAYPPSARLGTPEAIAELQDALGGEFRLEAQALPPGIQISLSGQPGIMGSNRWVFKHKEGYELAIAPELFTLGIDHRYQDRAAFAAVLEPALAMTARVGRLNEYIRLGVRYINAAPASAEDFQGWFKPEFTGWAGSGLVASGVSRTWIMITQLVRSDPASLVTNGAVRYGYLPGGVGSDITTSPAGESPSFIADIDLGSQRAATFEPATIVEAFRAINHEIAMFFENSMTPTGIEHFALRPKAD